MSSPPKVTHALSVREPWAWALTTGIKSVENRTWAFPAKRHPLPAWIAIHASLDYTNIAADVCDMFKVHPMIEPEIEGENAPRTGKTGRITLARSEIVGVVRIVDCVAVPNLELDSQLTDCIAAALDRPMSCRMAREINRLDWVAGDCFAWIVGDCYRFLRPIVAIGKLNVWEMAPALQGLVAEELKASMAEQVESIDRSRPYDSPIIFEMPKLPKKQLAYFA